MTRPDTVFKPHGRRGDHRLDRQDLREALRLFAELLADQERELGQRRRMHAQDPLCCIAIAIHQLGDSEEALRLFTELLR